MILEKDIMRKIEKLHESFALAIHHDFSETLGIVIDSEIAFVDQTTLGELIASLKNPSISYAFDVEGLAEPAIIAYSNPVSHALIDNALGKKPEGAFTQEQRGVKTWESILKLDPKNAELETNPESLLDDIARNSTVLLVALEINGPDFRGLLEVSYFNISIQPLTPKLEAWKPAA
jgi:flagellar motor switch protein FliM